ncbi:MAG TPA: hypothetical protein VJN44_14785 [Roseateles sp.]|nr:hypothetical protein [Roseateles sp.]
MDSRKSLIERLHQRLGMRMLHRFSDSALHTGLLVAIMAIVALTLVQAITTGVAVWQLDTVVVQGQAKR